MAEHLSAHGYDSLYSLTLANRGQRAGDGHSTLRTEHPMNARETPATRPSDQVAGPRVGAATTEVCYVRSGATVRRHICAGRTGRVGSRK